MLIIALLQEGALTAIASVADSSEEMFVKYYDAVMPLLSNILLNAQDKQVRAMGLRALANCLCVPGQAGGVGPVTPCARAWAQTIAELVATVMSSFV